MLKVTIAVPLVGCILLIMTVINYLKCAFTDPGFLPRSAPDETIFTEKINDITTDMSGYYYPSPKNKTIESSNGPILAIMPICPSLVILQCVIIVGEKFVT